MSNYGSVTYKLPKVVGHPLVTVQVEFDVSDDGEVYLDENCKVVGLNGKNFMAADIWIPTPDDRMGAEILKLAQDNHDSTCDCRLCQKDRAVAEADRKADEIMEREGA